MDPKHDRLPKRIDSLQGLRACGLLSIFFSHSVEGYASFGAAGVSIFLILSGFLLAYGYLQRDTALRQPSLANNLRFAVQKIKKLYPLHLVTMLLTIFLILLRPGLFSEANEKIPDNIADRSADLQHVVAGDAPTDRRRWTAVEYGTPHRAGQAGIHVVWH